MNDGSMLSVSDFVALILDVASAHGYKVVKSETAVIEGECKGSVQSPSGHYIVYEVSYDEGYNLHYILDFMTKKARAIHGLVLNSGARKSLNDYFANAKDHHAVMPLILEQKEALPRDLSKHYQFDEILELVKIAPVWLYGGPASGKTYMGGQLAEQLQVGYYPVPLGPTVGESRLVGFTAASRGEYVKGLCYEPFKEGGLLLLDEIDVADPQILVALNSMLDGASYRFPSGELVPRHKNFFVVAGANTVGTGGVGGFKRNSQDAALLSRFIKYRMEYDLELEAHVSQSPAWAAYIAVARDWMSHNATGSALLTPRKTYQGAAMLKAGIPFNRVYELLIESELVSPDVRQRFLMDVGKFDPTRTYVKKKADVSLAQHLTAKGQTISKKPKVNTF